MLPRPGFDVKKVESAWLNSQRMARVTATQVPFDKLGDQDGERSASDDRPRVRNGSRSLSLSKG